MFDQKICSVFSNNHPRPLLNFEALRCGTYRRAMLKKGRCLSKLSNIKVLPLRYIVLYIPELATSYFQFFIGLYSCSMCILIQLRLDDGEISNKRCFLMYGSHYKKAVSVMQRLLEGGVYLKSGVTVTKYSLEITTPKYLFTFK